MKPPRAVIVGGGFGGLYAAFALNRQAVDVTLLDRRNYHLFQPFLYQVATAGLSPADIAQPIRHILSRSPNIRVLLGEALSVDLDRRRVRLADSELLYDYLILAAGSHESYFGHDEWKPYAPGLKNIEEALEIRRRILLAFETAEHEEDGVERRLLTTFVVVGGGPTGVELAGALAEMTRRALVHDFRAIDPSQARIILLEGGPRLLPTFAEPSSAAAQRRLEKMGVEVCLNTPVTKVGPGFVEAGARRFDARTVLWAVGVSGSPLARTLGVPLDKAGRVGVRPDLSIPGHPEAFAIGDMARIIQDGRPVPGVAPAAIQMGRHAARNVLRLAEGKTALPFRYRDKGTMATIGRNSGLAEVAGLRLHGFIAWVLWVIVHIASLIGFRSKLMVMAEWLWSYVTYGRGVRLITGLQKPPGPPKEESDERRDADAVLRG